MLGAVGHPALDAVDVGLRVLVDPALVAAVLGGVDRHHERAAETPGQVVAGDRDEPVVPVDEVEVVAVAELDARGEHVGVHVLDPGHELAEVARAARLAHAVDDDAVDAPPRRASTRRRASGRGPRRPSATSASESLRTCRARPPSTTGGYSHERMRTRRLTARAAVRGERRARGCAGRGPREGSRVERIRQRGAWPSARSARRAPASARVTRNAQSLDWRASSSRTRARAATRRGARSTRSSASRAAPGQIGDLRAATKSQERRRAPRRRRQLARRHAGSWRSSASSSGASASPCAAASSTTARATRPLVPPVPEQLGVERAARAGRRPARRRAAARALAPRSPRRARAPAPAPRRGRRARRRWPTAGGGGSCGGGSRGSGRAAG